MVSLREATAIVGFRQMELIRDKKIRARKFDGKWFADRDSLLEYQIEQIEAPMVRRFNGRAATAEEQRAAIAKRNATKEPVPPKVKRPRGRPRKYQRAAE
jgi:hypothetical protein